MKACGAVGPQHWLCERLWTLLVPWLAAKGCTTEAFQLLESRVSCQREMFPWPCPGVASWCKGAQERHARLDHAEVLSAALAALQGHNLPGWSQGKAFLAVRRRAAW